MNFSSVSKAFLIVVLFTLSGCNQYQVKKRANSLERTLTSYNVALRWAEYETLYAYYMSPNGTPPPADLDKLQEVRVTEVNVKEKLINEDRTEGNVKTVVNYYIKTEGSVKTLKLDQKWWFNKTNKQWYIDGEFPKF